MPDLEKVPSLKGENALESRLIWLLWVEEHMVLITVLEGALFGQLRMERSSKHSITADVCFD